MMTSERREKIIELFKHHEEIENSITRVVYWCDLARMTDGDLIDRLIDWYRQALEKIETLQAEVKELSKKGVE